MRAVGRNQTALTGNGWKGRKGKAVLDAGKGRVLARLGWVGVTVRAVQDSLSVLEVE